MEGLIMTLKREYKFFKQPQKIGDTFEIQGVPYLIIGIQKFELYTSLLRVWYTVQDLSKTDYISKQKLLPTNQERILVTNMKHDDERLRKLYLGMVTPVNGQLYKLTEWTNISFVSTNIKIEMAGRPVYPMHRKEAKIKYLEERRKKLKFEVL